MNREVELIASRFHAGTAFAHAIGLWFNLRNRRYGHSAVHAAFLLYDAFCAFSHNSDASGNYETYEQMRWRQQTSRDNQCS